MPAHKLAVPNGMTQEGTPADFMIERVYCEPPSTCETSSPLSYWILFAAMDGGAITPSGSLHNFVTDHYTWITMDNVSGQTLASAVHYPGGPDNRVLFWWQQAL